MPYLLIPSTNVGGDLSGGILYANSSPGDTLTGLVNGTSYRVYSLDVGPNATPNGPAPSINLKSGTLRNPSVAMGLGGIADYGASQPFIDVMKSSREWTGRSPTQFGSTNPPEMRSGGHLDANGWPIRIPPGDTSVGAIILTEINAADTTLNGRYRTSWLGEGTINVNGGVSNVTRGTGWLEFDYVANTTNLILIEITAITSGNHIRNITCIKKTNQALYDAGEIFRPEWLDLIRNMRLVRFMDWQATNNSTLSAWSQRPLTTSSTWTTGTPVETMVALANKIGSDPWFCIPHLATNDYITRFATYVRDNLDPKLEPYFEYSNEVWNFQFDQAQYANSQAGTLWPGQGDGWMQWYGGKTAEMAMLIDTVYQSSTKRYKKVITAHTGWVDLNAAALDAPRWVSGAAGRQAPKNYCDVYAITGYFGGYVGGSNNLATLQSWRQQGDAAAFTLMEQEILDGRHNVFDVTHIDGLENTFVLHKNIANSANLDLVMYEGGSHMLLEGSAIDADPTLIQFMERFHYSENMGRLYTRIMNSFRTAGGEFFNIFVEMGTGGRHGWWGARRHTMDSNPRWNAIVNYNNTIEGPSGRGQEDFVGPYDLAT